MFDTMTLTKAFGALCGALLFFLLGGWAAESLYHVGGDDEVQGYVLITEDADSEAEEEEVIEVAFADVYATADAAAGERLWRQCQACHALNGTDGVGPHLNGVVDRPKHSVDGFNYSDALLALEGAWTPENISNFIANPRAYAQGTAMSYAGMRDIEDRANLIAYLATTE
ncbi:cytochrome c family protein [Maritalea mobilis]|uniref:c-type cytochrome n=1 Tax=Maritalea mobilis TaxID=483324 RepID=UPI001C96B953|nr:cytochrome c family protein [Maritalea mobilis]MBY6202661.1 cytochrome c family protein [Maritalea mobilis]